VAGLEDPLDRRLEDLADAVDQAGIAVSGHTVQQRPQAVQFSGIHAGWP
jgi:predicted transcriptional regulator